MSVIKGNIGKLKFRMKLILVASVLALNISCINIRTFDQIPLSKEQCVDVLKVEAFFTNVNAYCNFKNYDTNLTDGAICCAKKLTTLDQANANAFGTKTFNTWRNSYTHTELCNKIQTNFLNRYKIGVR